MSILLIDPPQELGAALVTQLTAEGDEVRVIERRRSEVHRWRTLGAHVALGDSSDDDLLERAAVNVRTVVFFDPESRDTADTLRRVEALRRAQVDRVVVTAKKDEAKVSRILERVGIDYVILVARRKLLGGSPDPASIARAVSAADDLAGTPRLVIDLGDPNASEGLRLPTP